MRLVGPYQTNAKRYWLSCASLELKSETNHQADARDKTNRNTTSTGRM